MKLLLMLCFTIIIFNSCGSKHETRQSIFIHNEEKAKEAFKDLDTLEDLAY